MIIKLGTRATGFLPRLLQHFLPIVLIASVVAGIFFLTTAAEEEAALVTNEEDHIHAASENVKRALLTLVRDTAVLADLTTLNRAIRTNAPDDLQDAKRDFLSFADNKRVYGKVRWMDETGHERLKVELLHGHARAAPPNGEENETQRDYFREAMQLAEGEVYLSPLDLEMDEGQIEQPLHPVMRAARRVFDSRGRSRGIVVLTYEADDLYQRIERVASSADAGWMLVDSQGYWLRSPQHEDEFGSQLPHRRSMATRYPRAWQTMHDSPLGHIKDGEGGWWLYEDVLSGDVSGEDGASRAPLDWKLVKHVEAGSLARIHRPVYRKTSLVLALVLALGFVVSVRLARSQLLKDKREAELHDALRELEQQKLALDEHAIVSILDARGTIGYVNDKLCAISGYGRSELIGQHHRLLGSGAHDAKFFRALYRTVLAGKAWHGEICNRAKDGSLYWVNTTIVPLLDGRERPQRYVVICTDITGTKLHEAMLEEAQRLGKLGHWQLDLNSNKLTWSKEIFNIFEMDPEGFGTSYEAFLRLVHPEDRELVDRSFRDSVERHHSYAIEHRLLFPDGRIKWVSEFGSTHYDRKGRPMLSLGTVQDITERKVAEERLRISSIAFETQEAIIVTDAEARIISVNHSFEKLTGYSANEAIGKNPNILKSGRHDAEFYRSMWYSLKEAGSWSGEMWDRRKDGTLYPKWLTITAVRNEAGQITHFVAIFMDISERKRAEEEIHRLAFYDTLTQLPNRRLLMDRLDQALAVSQRSGSHGALMFMDLDNFKTINDTQGHDIGDLLLVEVASRLKYCLRESDTVARLGGDEFVVILQELGESAIQSANQAEAIAEKIVSALGEPYLLANYEHHSGVSIGVCLFHGRDAKLEELLKRADTAMYQAKQGGRNMVRFFESAMQIAVEERAKLEGRLRHALGRQELQLYYQLQVDSQFRIIGAEALLRWFNAEQGFVPPTQFIPVAEESGLILTIGAWVLETACRQLHVWAQHAGSRQLQLGVNVSARQFRQADFVGQVEAMLQRYAFDPSRLKLELTESVVLVDINDTIAKMGALKKLGVKIAMDDFGTGYSSLSYLKMLPLDQLKIDQSFVRDIVVDRNDEVIVRTIIDMAHNFGLDVIAEGVETGEQLERLQRIGCPNYQGHYFSKPIPLKEFESLLSEVLYGLHKVQKFIGVGE